MSRLLLGVFMWHASDMCAYHRIYCGQEIATRMQVRPGNGTSSGEAALDRARS